MHKKGVVSLLIIWFVLSLLLSLIKGPSVKYLYLSKNQWGLYLYFHYLAYFLSILFTLIVPYFLITLFEPKSLKRSLWLRSLITGIAMYSWNLLLSKLFYPDLEWGLIIQMSIFTGWRKVGILLYFLLPLIDFWLQKLLFRVGMQY